MKIIPIKGELMRFYAESETGHGTYMVDLLANKGLGACACTDFTTRRIKARKQGAHFLSPAGSCKHLKACYNSVLEGVLAELTKTYG